MLPVSLDCPFLIALSVFSNVYLSCVPYVAVSLDCPFLIALSVFSNVYLSCGEIKNGQSRETGNIGYTR
jgi:hypothetical protein